MIQNNSIAELVDLVDANTIRVHPPTSILFLCGGKLALEGKPPSLREAFTRVFYTRPKLQRHAILMAEDVNAFFPEGKYQDILSFEADIAQIADLIILFSESFGSAAEMGAFSMVEEIALRLLVVIDDANFGERSFITLGPLRSLENRHGETSVCVLRRDDIKIASIDDIEGLDISVFGERMEAAIGNRQATSREHSRFDPLRPGHAIKLITGLIQYYGALTLDEIELFLERFGCRFSRDRISDLLLCSEFAKWTVKIRGVVTYYCAVSGTNEALQFTTKHGLKFDKLKWRADVRAYWKDKEPDRFSIIQTAYKEVLA